ncbi:ADP-ribose glycohydrolase MACROD2 isoform X2 [Triplophysa dalaica]|uniref:ADP-ribose glycohydrolase MACROD2 isoform X2 n=1 Tax=Triplophysa dalaica TaxID=1582913 RepID=UPI0024DF3793|nr:ADP-ribose glycohydrolase MACROD2 isoform X2 [Triplophysa dalaica]
MSKKKKEWRAEKERLLSLSTEDRRKDYRGNYLELDKIPTWASQENSTATEDEEQKSSSPADKVSLYKGDITILEVDAIVNAANSSLLGGGGVDGCIHRAAGHLLFEECHSLNGCDTGQAKITCGYDLPAKYVIHTVGPIARGNLGQSQRDDLEACYKTSLKLMKDNNLRSVAFPCISTGIYGFPNDPAAEIALKTVKGWIEKNKDEIDLVIFCVFLETDYEIYKKKMSHFFSPDNDGHEEEEEEDAKMEDDNTLTEGGEEIEPGGDAKADAEMMSQPDENCGDDVTMESQKQDEGPDVKPLEQGNEEHAQGDPEVEESPPTKKKLEEGNKVKEREEEKKEEKSGDPVAGEEDSSGKTEDSPGKKMKTGQTDAEGKQRKGSTKSAEPKDCTGQGGDVPMDLQDGDKSEVKATKENTSTKDEMKAQDKSSPESESAPTDSSQPKDGQEENSAQRKE